MFISLLHFELAPGVFGAASLDCEVILPLILSVQVYFGTQHAKMYLNADLLGINCVTGMSCLFRKDVLEDAGGFEYLGKYLAEDFYLGKVFLERSVSRLIIFFFSPYTPCALVVVGSHRNKSSGDFDADTVRQSAPPDGR